MYYTCNCPWTFALRSFGYCICSWSSAVFWHHQPNVEQIQVKTIQKHGNSTVNCNKCWWFCTAACCSVALTWPATITGYPLKVVASILNLFSVAVLLKKYEWLFNHRVGNARQFYLVKEGEFSSSMLDLTFKCAPSRLTDHLSCDVTFHPATSTSSLAVRWRNRRHTLCGRVLSFMIKSWRSIAIELSVWMTTQQLRNPIEAENDAQWELQLF